MAHIAFQESRVVTAKKKNHLIILKNIIRQSHQAHPNLSQKRQKFFHFLHNRALRNDNKFPSISSGSLQLVVVTNTKIFENNHLSRVAIAPIQQRSQDMAKDVLFSVGAQDMDTSGSEVSDFDDIEFFPENPP